MTWTQTVLNIKDANNTTQPVIAFTDGTNFSFAHPLLDATGAIISTTNGLPIVDAYQSPATSTWTSSTSLNTALTATTSGMDTVVITCVPSGTITGGVVTFEVYDGTTWLPIKASRIESYSTEGSYTLTGTTRAWQIPVAGFPQFRARLSTVITGSGSVLMTSVVSSAPDTSLVTVGIDPNAPLPAGTNTVGAVAAGVNVIAGNTTTRPANTTAYALGQLVANSTTAGSVVPATIAAARGTNIPTAAIRCRLQKSNASTTNAIFRVHFFNASPTVANGDGGTFTPQLANWCGSFDVTINQAGSDYACGIGLPTYGPAMVFTPASGTSNLYYLIEARGAYTPASGEVFTPTLEIQ